jgi:hypothetical protein
MARQIVCWVGVGTMDTFKDLEVMTSERSPVSVSFMGNDGYGKSDIPSDIWPRYTVIAQGLVNDTTRGKDLPLSSMVVWTQSPFDTLVRGLRQQWDVKQLQATRQLFTNFQTKAHEIYQQMATLEQQHNIRQRIVVCLPSKINDCCPSTYNHHAAWTSYHLYNYLATQYPQLFVVNILNLAEYDAHLCSFKKLKPFHLSTTLPTFNLTSSMVGGLTTNSIDSSTSQPISVTVPQTTPLFIIEGPNCSFKREILQTLMADYTNDLGQATERKLIKLESLQTSFSDVVKKTFGGAQNDGVANFKSLRKIHKDSWLEKVILDNWVLAVKLAVSTATYHRLTGEITAIAMVRSPLSMVLYNLIRKYHERDTPFTGYRTDLLNHKPLKQAVKMIQELGCEVHFVFTQPTDYWNHFAEQQQRSCGLDDTDENSLWQQTILFDALMAFLEDTKQRPPQPPNRIGSVMHIHKPMANLDHPSFVVTNIKAIIQQWYLESIDNN